MYLLLIFRNVFLTDLNRREYLGFLSLPPFLGDLGDDLGDELGDETDESVFFSEFFNINRPRFQGFNGDTTKSGRTLRLKLCIRLVKW